MKHRKLRIAWSATWGVVAVLVCALWVRSYRVGEVFARLKSNGWNTSIGSNGGAIYFDHSDLSGVPLGTTNQQWEIIRTKVSRSAVRYRWRWNATTMHIHVPYYFLVTLLAAAGLMPWFGTRFSLRTLLIATTLVAVSLDIILWMSRGG